MDILTNWGELAVEREAALGRTCRSPTLGRGFEAILPNYVICKM